ncbi:MAG: GHKL domain-containing protein [Clostridia bacterium]|nr:GHKL domain-containing protein [Clostridia bacterium]
MKFFRLPVLKVCAVLLAAILLVCASLCYAYANDQAGMGEIFTYTDFRNTESYSSRLQEASEVMESLAREVYDGSRVTAVDLEGTAVDGAFHYYFYADGTVLTDIPSLDGMDFSHAKTTAVYHLGVCYLMDTVYTQAERFARNGDYDWKPYDLTQTVSLSVFSCDAGAILVPAEEWIQEQYSLWDTAKNLALAFILFLSLAVLPMLYLVLAACWTEPAEPSKRRFGVFTELKILFGALSVIFFLQILDTSFLIWLRSFFTLFGRGDNQTVYPAFSVVFTLLVFAFLAAVLGLIRSGKNGKMVKGSFLWWVCHKPFLAMRKRFSPSYARRYRYSMLFFLRTIVFLILEIALLIFFGITVVNRYWIVVQLILLFAVLLVAVLYCYASYRDVHSLNRLLEHISALQEGNLSYRAPIDKEDVFSDYEEQLRSVGDGFDQTLRSQVSAERSRVNLITNVSHDLRTPLTSIIGYLDLLSKVELSPEARDYVRILTEKSNRLNHLVSDVFALSKANSGAEEISMEELDLFLLARQLVADLSDSAAAAGKTVLLKGDGKAPLRSNGNKIYRILQNMLDNALKYSLAGTRVFVTLSADETAATVTVKNTASYEMNFSAEEISEQFVRGDPSRTGEGSGLGLAIAKSFAEQLGATFSLSIDGDQFASSVSFPLNNEINGADAHKEDS